MGKFVSMKAIDVAKVKLFICCGAVQCHGRGVVHCHEREAVQCHGRGVVHCHEREALPCHSCHRKGAVSCHGCFHHIGGKRPLLLAIVHQISLEIKTA